MKPSRGAAWLAILPVCALLGCLSPNRNATREPYGKGPSFQFPVQSVSTAMAAIPVSVKDQRPEWERAYYPGSNMLHRHDWAVTFLPLENFEPSFRGSLTAELQRQAVSLSSSPASVDVRLASFWLVYDERPLQGAEFQEIENQRLQEERQREREEAERARQQAELDARFPNPDKEKESESTTAVIAAAVVAIVVVPLVKAAYYASGQAIQESRRGELHLDKPPKAITKEYHPGLSCRIAAQVTVRWKDGRSFETHLKRVHFPATQSTDYTASDIPRAVAECIRGMGGEFVKQSEAYLAGNRKPAKSN